MGDLLRGVPVVSLLAVVAVPARGVVSALETDAPRHPAGQFVQLHVESASSGVLVALAGCNQKRELPSAGQLRGGAEQLKERPLGMHSRR